MNLFTPQRQITGREILSIYRQLAGTPLCNFTVSIGGIVSMFVAKAFFIFSMEIYRLLILLFWLTCASSPQSMHAK